MTRNSGLADWQGAHLLCKTNLSRLGKVAVLSNVQKPTQNMCQIKEQDNFPEK